MKGRLALALSFSAALASAEAPPLGNVVDAPLFTPELYHELLPVEPAVTVWLQGRLPGVRLDTARHLDLGHADGILGQAVARGYTGSDVFSDAGLRSDRLYFMYAEEVRALFDRYEMHVITLPYGETSGGGRYECQGLLLGGNRVILLYNLPEFEFHNPFFGKHEFRFHDPVIHTIRGPGDLGIDNAWVKWQFLWPKLNRFVKINETDVRVETSLGSTTDPLVPITRR